jgi:flavin-binding protein dodecin
VEILPATGFDARRLGSPERVSLLGRAGSKLAHHRYPGGIMAKQAAGSDTVYKVVEVIGTSTQSWEDAARKAVETASQSLRDLRIAEVVKMDMKVENGKVLAYRTRVLLSFKYES